MKKLVITFAAALSTLLLSLNAEAQDFKSGYFLDNYVYSYELNPALHQVDNTVCFAGLAVNNIYLSTLTNIGSNSLFFPVQDTPGQYNLFTAVPKEQFLAVLPADRLFNMNMDLNLDLLSFGFKCGQNGFFSFDLRIKSHSNITASRDLFETVVSDLGSVIQAGVSEVGVRTDNYAELALGYSFKLAEGLRMGITAKGLAGLAAANISMKDLYVDVDTDNWRDYKLSGDFNLNVSTPMLTLGSNERGYYDFQNISEENFAPSKFNISGLGAALDLGVSWESPFGLTIDASILDIGGISWKQNIYAGRKYSNEQLPVDADELERVFDGVKTMEEAVDKAMPYVSMLFGPAPKSGARNQFAWLPVSFNLGLRYKMPFYQRLSVGLLGNYTLNSPRPFDVRAGITITPADEVSISANGGYNSLGWAFGSALNFRLGPIAIFAGFDALKGVNGLIGIVDLAQNGKMDAVTPFNFSLKAGILVAPKIRKKK